MRRLYEALPAHVWWRLRRRLFAAPDRMRKYRMPPTILLQRGNLKSTHYFFFYFFFFIPDFLFCFDAHYTLRHWAGYDIWKRRGSLFTEAEIKHLQKQDIKTFIPTRGTLFLFLSPHKHLISPREDSPVPLKPHVV